VLVPAGCGGAGVGIFAFLAAGCLRPWRRLRAICPSHKAFEPQGSEIGVYDEMYGCGGSCILGLERWVGVRSGCAAGVDEVAAGRVGVGRYVGVTVPILALFCHALKISFPNFVRLSLEVEKLLYRAHSVSVRAWPASSLT